MFGSWYHGFAALRQCTTAPASLDLSASIHSHVVVANGNPDAHRFLMHFNGAGFAAHLDHTLRRHFRTSFVGSVPSSARKLCRLMI